MDFDVGLVAKAKAELGGESWVELDEDEAAGAGSEQVGDGAVAGADLEDGAGGDVAEAGGYVVAGDVVGQEILAELGLASLGHTGRGYMGGIVK